jgi:hypothetical protein
MIKLFKYSRYIIAMTLFSVSAETVKGAPSNPDWKIIQTKYPTSDIVVAGFNVLDFGAQGDGKSDCTEAFQNALNRMHKAGGGTVFVPEGRYAFSGNLKIPVAVTLRGEWRQPSKEEPAVAGTLLMAYAGKGDADGEPFITVDYCAGIKDLNIWYPKQTALAPTPYPFCLIQKGGNNATFENLTLINPYQGIRIGPGANELHLVRNVYGTPLKTGIRYDSTTDIGRLEKIRFSPRWWCKSGLPAAPRKIDWLKKKGTAIHMLRSDWEYVADVEIDGYDCGFRISEGVRGAANAQFYHLIIRNCNTAMEIEKTNPYGMVFAECYFGGDKYGVYVDEKFDSCLMFSTCIFEGKEALHSAGDGNILMEQCRIAKGNLVLEKGAHSILGSTFKNKSSRINISKGVVGVSLSGNQYPSPLPIVKGKTSDDTLQQADEPLPLNPIPAYPKLTDKKFSPSRISLEVVLPTGDDDSVTIQQAMDEQARNGGGIVLLPSPNYLIKGHLKVPTGVELRGIHDVPHHTMGGGSILHIYPPDDEPTLILEAQSGLRGLCFNYPEQISSDIKTYPFLIQGHGSDIYVININASNPFKFMDFMTYRCDNHFIEYPSGSPLNTGIAVGGGSQNGYVGNMQFNPHYALRLPHRNKLFSLRDDFKVLWPYQKENLDALVIGNCNGEFLYQNFVFGSLYGIHFTEQDGEGAQNCISHGHGTDGSKVGLFFEYGHGTITMVNNELVAMSSQNKTAIKVSEAFDSEATMINTMVWGSPDLLADIRNGTLTLQNLHANHHGQGLILTKGTLQAFNLSFNQSGKHLTAAEGTQAQITGFITKESLHIESSGETVNTSGNISRR